VKERQTDRKGKVKQGLYKSHKRYYSFTKTKIVLGIRSEIKERQKGKTERKTDRQTG